jgi:hypothetical protein
VFEPTIAGFGSSDVIDWSGTVTSAVYASGTLTLLDGSAKLAKLELAGNFTGESFLVTSVENETQISLYNVPGNAPPVITAPATLSAVSGASTPIPGVSIADSDANSAHETLTVVLIDTYGLLSANKSAPGGGGVISGSGTKDLLIQGSLTQVNADLTSLTFTSTTVGPDSILIAANDGRGGTDNATIAVTVGSGGHEGTSSGGTAPPDFAAEWLRSLYWENLAGQSSAAVADTSWGSRMALMPPSDAMACPGGMPFIDYQHAHGFPL